MLRRILKISGQIDLKESAVTVLTRNPDSFLHSFPEFSEQKWLKFCRGDILQSLEKISSEGQIFSHVLHAAADSTLGPSMGSLERFNQIVTGTRNVLDFAVKVKARKFLLTSSGGVYGDLPSNLESFPEFYMGMANPLDPFNAYSVAKRLAEHLSCLYADSYGLEVVVARCFAFVGPDLPLDAHFAIGNFIRDALNGGPITINGDGSPMRSYLFQDDLADWLLALIDRGSSGNAYNVGSDQPISILDLARLIKSTLSTKSRIDVKGLGGANRIIRSRYIPNIEKIKQELDVEITIPLVSAIELTAQKYLDFSRPGAING
ncbi:NAD(P)-dependent oxidoreductase [Polynucleobacter paneuropaeus]|nr:NAD(P)-dependent oxidoreductase [Polynucleobacter paneuropaeus]